MGEANKRIVGAAAVLTGMLTLATLGAGTTYATDPPPTNTTHITIASFNVLGASHTTHSKKYAVAWRRMKGEVALLQQHGVEVVGLQELQATQLTSFLNRTAGTFAVYPGLTGPRKVDVEDSIAWRIDTWTLVSATTVQIPYFNGRIRNMPVVLLSNNATGVLAYFANFHNPATNKAHPGQWKWRKKAIADEAALANQLSASGLPVFFTGDMNERARVFCPITGRSQLVAARGGTNRPGGTVANGGCKPNRPWYVDWIFTSPGITHDGYVEDRTSADLHLSDHPMIVTGATIDPSKFSGEPQPTS
ncbi:MAG: endonuclease/exonuclease/phosphatase family protein [Nocardioidaceae bacterium]